jgi:hypothetical protein
MSVATIDRYLAPPLTEEPLHGIATTTAGSLLRNSITVRKARDESEAVYRFLRATRSLTADPR